MVRYSYDGVPIEIVYGLSNSAILTDLERPQTQNSRSRHSLTVNTSDMAKDMAIVVMEHE